MCTSDGGRKSVHHPPTPTIHAQAATYTTTHQIHTCLNSMHIMGGNNNTLTSSCLFIHPSYLSYFFSCVDLHPNQHDEMRSMQYCCCSRFFEAHQLSQGVRSHSHDTSFMHIDVSLFYSYTVVAETHFVIVTVP
jgi:hypothetical protein